MAHHRFETPLSEEDVRKLGLEDTITFSGAIFGMRDATQIRIFDEGRGSTAGPYRVGVPAYGARRPATCRR